MTGTPAVVNPRRFSSLAEWLQWQETAAPQEIELGLERCHEVAQRIDADLRDPIVVTVAGTNGKGSSVAMLEKAWCDQGYRVAAYTSPHMIAYNERIRINGKSVSSERICAAFEHIEDVRDDIHLTYFEYGALAAVEIFKAVKPDVVILEVGLGGRLDAVNIFDADVALITSIGIDHVEFLGNDRESIGREKAGIMRADRPVVCSDPDVPNSVIEHAGAIGARLQMLGADFRFSENASSWDWWSGDRQHLALPKPNLVGDYQFRNAAGVVAVIELLRERLPVDRATLETMLETISLWGRFQRFSGQIEYILDVAHNAQAVEQFVKTLVVLPCSGRTHLVLGMLRAKDREGVIALLADAVDRWYLTDVQARRGASAQELAESLNNVVENADAATYNNVASALDAARGAAESGDRILALGSFLVVSEALKFLQQHGHPAAIPSAVD